MTTATYSSKAITYIEQSNDRDRPQLWLQLNVIGTFVVKIHDLTKVSIKKKPILMRLPYLVMLFIDNDFLLHFLPAC